MTRAEALAFVVAPMPPGYARQLVRDALKGWSAEDVAAWHRLRDNERKAAKRDAVKHEAEAEAVRLAAQQPTGQVPVGVEGADRTSSGWLHDDKPDIENPPQVPPVPPPNPASTPTYARPTLEQVISSMNASLGCRIPPDERSEVAQAYLDTRNRSDPPWTLDATVDKPARRIGADWQADCRIFCRNWREILDRNAARETARNTAFKTHGNPHQKLAAVSGRNDNLNAGMSGQYNTTILTDDP